MFRLWIVAFLCFALVNISDAAESEPPPCDIDLSQSAALLVRAQAQASAGDNAAALRLMDEVVAALDAIAATCAGITDADSPAPPADDPTSATDETTQTYTPPEGTFSAEFPAEWQLSGDAFSVLAGTSDNAITALTLIDVPLRRGDRGAAVVIGTPDMLAPDVVAGGGVDDIIAAFRRTFTDDFGLSIGAPQDLSVNEREGQGFRYNTAGYSGLLLAAPLDDDDTFMLILVIAVTGEDADLPTLALDIAASVRLLDANDE
ncbi:MAG: hypothetical protein EA396_12480 [Anaerolineaceae bacterium]|nr:MAG: hypothetical protein EA396_12480 [Anaerolineaceae bacterium]